ncbi:MAG TPA: ABC transporter permease [Terriglobales bacterium]|jgi:ABC-2 type transport system permease protein|nr:ABC transporter permease [Terriglobales bacterium]
MHNVWILLRREYLERVRSRSFIIFTVLMPAIMAGSVLVPAKIAEMSSGGEKRIVIVANDPQLGAAVGHELGNSKTNSDPDVGQSELQPTLYTIQVDTDTSDAERDLLAQQVNEGKITGFLWLSDEALANHKVVYSTKEAADFDQSRELHNAIRTAVTRHRLAQKGMSGPELDSLLTPITLKTVRPEKGKPGASNTTIFVTAFAMVVLLYAVVMIYGLAVMRSVIEEKSTRIMEVLLSSATSKQLLAGKILGVGAVGLTQILVWVIFAGLFSVPGLLAAKSFLGEVHLSIFAVAAFAVFFLLGYLLYSAMYAAIGAMVNSDQEAQQVQWPAMMPIVIAVFLMSAVIQHPNSAMAFWLSIVPFFAPILMLVRVLIETPPLWQIALCIALMLATIYGLLVLSSRIYRVGILMYGKRPTLPELRRWLKYAG